MSGFFGTYLDTVGVELEGIGISGKYDMGKILSKMRDEYHIDDNKVQITHDASTEFNASFIRTSSGGVWISNHTPEMMDIFGGQIAGQKLMGYELVTFPMEVPKMGNVLYPLISTLVNNGDFVSDRASIHFHVGFVNNLRILQNFLRIALMVEPVLYRLGGMGRTFRGRINQCAYARPLLNSVAVNIANYSGTKFARIINPIAALEAETLEQFWASFGVEYKIGGGVAKYHACRYGGFNFYAVPQHGTIEFRHCNQSHNTFLIIAIAKFDRGLAELSTVISKKELASLAIVPSNTEISVGDATEIINRMMKLCHEHEIKNLPDDCEMETIMQTIAKSHFESITDIPVLVHLQDGVNTISAQLAREGRLEFFNKVLPPHFVDIHNISYSSIFDGVKLSDELSLKIPHLEFHGEDEEEEIEHDDDDFEDENSEEGDDE